MEICLLNDEAVYNVPLLRPANTKLIGLVDIVLGVVLRRDFLDGRRLAGTG
jgi:hypothetical protein